MNPNYKKSRQIDRISKRYLPLLIILLTYSPIAEALDYGKLQQLYNYIIYGALASFSLMYFGFHRGKLIKEYPQISALYAFLIVYVVAACVKLYFVPSSIFLFQRLVCFCSFLSIGTIFLLIREGIIKRILRMWWRYVPWITFASLTFVQRPRALPMMFMVFLFVMLAECLRKQLRFITYAILFFLSMFGIYQRMDYLQILAPVVVYLMIKFNVFMTYSKSARLYSILMCIPVFFLVVALLGNFNVLHFDSYVKGEYTSASGEDMTADTRTGLYEEAISSAVKHGYLLYGRTPGYGYDSKFAASRDGSYLKVDGVAPQRYSEVFVVNIFTWCGVIGIVVWLLWFFWFGIHTLKRAKNNYIRGLVIYMGFFWVCCWISNNFCQIDHRFILVYIIISICVQPEFQRMSNEEIKHYFKRMLH